jgi:hypothetical protein
MLDLFSQLPAIRTIAPVMQATAPTKRISSDTVNIQLLRIWRLNCLDESAYPTRALARMVNKWLTSGLVG